MYYCFGELEPRVMTSAVARALVGAEGPVGKAPGEGATPRS